MTAMDPPPLTILQPGEGATGDLGMIGVAFKFWGRDTNGQVSVVEHPFPVGASFPHTSTPERTSTQSSPRERSAFGPATVR